MRVSLHPQTTLLLLILVCLVGLFGCSSPQDGSALSANMNSAATVPTQTNAAVITGSSFQEDAIGDVLDGNYRKPTQKLPGIDIRSIQIESVGPDLKVVFTSNSDFPTTMPPDQSAVWHINACTPDGNRCCLFGAKVVRSEWIAYISEMTPPSNTYVKSPVIKGNELIVTLPHERLPEWMRKPFKWWASSEWNGNWEDRMPDEGRDILNAPTVPFPTP
jgi:hypothetical protein